MRGLYVHIPFCVHKCDYCDFYSLPERLDSLEAYLTALMVEAERYGNLRFKTLFVGGGTPSLLQSEGLRKLMQGLSTRFQFTKVQEATIEVNPDSVSRDFLKTALDCGINRLSIGIQALSNDELQRVGRIHNASEGIQAIELSQKLGFENISADVILGLPGQNWQSLKTTLETLIGMNLRHISMYCLTVEPHTPLAARIPEDLPSDDDQAELYSQAVLLLEKRGLIHYEISNFAQPGYECQHNLNYWRAGEYIGLGPAAASYYRGSRYKNKADLDSYLVNPTGQKDETENLSKPEKAGEEAILRLRLLHEGLDLDHLIQKYGDRNVIGLAARLKQLSQKGHLKPNGSVYRLNPQDALVSNPILAELLGE